jgi:hypothetical protein
MLISVKVLSSCSMKTFFLLEFEDINLHEITIFLLFKLYL